MPKYDTDTQFDCFLCYAKEDKEEVDEIYLKLRQSGIRVWMDKPPKPYEMDGLAIGQSWQLRIEEVIATTRYFISFFSNKSVEKKGYVQREYRLALEEMSRMPDDAIYLIPVLLEPCDPPKISNLGIKFENYQWVDLESEGVDFLVKSLKRQIGLIEFKKYNTVYAKNASELLDSLEHGNRIVLDGYYPLSREPLKDRWNLRYSKVFDGISIEVRETENLCLSGNENERPLVEVEPAYAYVLTFSECKNLVIENISFGHGPELGECAGGVLEFHRCENVIVRNCDLFGCGTEAFKLFQCRKVVFENCVLRDCTYYIGTVDESSEVTFSNCRFLRNKEWRGISITNSKIIQIHNSEFHNNEFSGSFFEIFAVHNFSISETIFSNNTANALGLPSSLNLDKVKFVNNSWNEK